MSNKAGSTRIVPAICTQCGARIDVDPSRDAAICPHCETAFVVEKAVNNFNILGSQIVNVEHIETVNINTPAETQGSPALHFIDKHLDRLNRMRLERQRVRAEQEAQMMKYMPLLVIVALIACVAMIYLMTRAQ